MFASGSVIIEEYSEYSPLINAGLYVLYSTYNYKHTPILYSTNFWHSSKVQIENCNHGTVRGNKATALQLYSSTTLQPDSSTTLQPYSSTTLQLSLQPYNSTALLLYTSTPLQRYSPRTLQSWSKILGTLSRNSTTFTSFLITIYILAHAHFMQNVLSKHPLSPLSMLGNTLDV